jgi:hypothetical protein
MKHWPQSKSLCRFSSAAKLRASRQVGLALFIGSVVRLPAKAPRRALPRYARPSPSIAGLGTSGYDPCREKRTWVVSASRMPNRKQCLVVEELSAPEIRDRQGNPCGALAAALTGAAGRASANACRLREAWSSCPTRKHDHEGIEGRQDVWTPPAADSLPDIDHAV